MSVIQLFDLNGEQRFTGTSVGPFPLQAGSGSPVDLVTPDGIGAVYVDTTTGALYTATGTTSADWLVYGHTEGNVGEAPGIVWNSPNRQMYILAGERDVNPTGDVVFICTAYAQWNGVGNNVSWNANGGDGQESFEVTTGSSAQHIGVLQDRFGTMTLASGGIKFPTADPHIVGAWWDNAGVLTKSAG